MLKSEKDMVADFGVDFFLSSSKKKFVCESKQFFGDQIHCHSKFLIF